MTTADQPTKGHTVIGDELRGGGEAFLDGASKQTGKGFAAVTSIHYVDTRRLNQ